MEIKYEKNPILVRVMLSYCLKYYRHGNYNQFSNPYDLFRQIMAGNNIESAKTEHFLDLIDKPALHTPEEPLNKMDILQNCKELLW